jgi:hypothetical protein
MTTATAVKHEMAVMDGTGDSKIMWSEDSQDEIDAARATFDSLRKKGYLAYSVNKKGDKADVLDRFDPSAERIIMSPQLKGG